MKRLTKTILTCLICFIFMLSSVCANSIRNLSGLIYINDLDKLSKEQFSKIRDCGELKYILTQLILYPDIFDRKHAVERDRIVQLAKTGKRMIIQIWFGPGGAYNWSYCGYPNIAMQQEVRDYLFPVIDQAIDQIGPENIYGMHLLEEDGHLGVDIDEPGDWRQNKGAVRSGKEDGNTYTNYNNLRKRYGGPSDWTPSVPNIAQYNPVFKSETGLDMFILPKNDPLANSVLDRWMARRLWAGAHREFFKHLSEKYPTIRKFTWGNIAQPWNGTAIGDLRDVIDGVITNPYNDTLAIHHTLSGLRALLPEAEHLVLLKGDPDISEKYIRTATAYLNGASAIGFYEKALDNEKLWDDNIRIWRKISTLPVAKTNKSKVLIITGNTDNGYSTSKVMLPFFNMPIVLTKRDATDVDLNRYGIVVLHYSNSFRNDLALAKYNIKGPGPDDQHLKDWVARGGVLVLTAPFLFSSDSQFFLADERIALMPNKWLSMSNEPVTFTCKAEIAQKYNIKSEYNLLAMARDISWGENTAYDKLPVGGVTKYGQGKIIILPIFHNDKIMLAKSTSDEFRNLWQKAVADYIADVIRGVVQLHDSSGAIINELNPSGESFGLKWADGDSRINVQTKFERFGQKFSSEIIKSGDYIMGSR